MSKIEKVHITRNQIGENDVIQLTSNQDVSQLVSQTRAGEEVEITPLTSESFRVKGTAQEMTDLGITNTTSPTITSMLASLAKRIKTLEDA